MSDLQDQDAQWLREIVAALDDRIYAALRARLDDALPELRAELGWDEERARAFRNHAVELGPDSLLASLFEIALRRLPESFEQPVDLYFIQVGAPTLNGLSLRAPSGTPVIALNHGLITYISQCTHVVLGLTGMEPPLYCTHHSVEEFLLDLDVLARGLLSGVPAHLLGTKSISCLGTDLHASTEPVHHGFCLLAEFFIIFHELGHLLLGHLQLEGNRSILLEETEYLDEVEMLAPAHRDELEADRFAFQRILEFCEGGDLRPRDAAYSVGCLMVLMHVAERAADRPTYDTHPPAAERWSQIRALFANDEPGRWTQSIDYIFERLSDDPIRK